MDANMRTWLAGGSTAALTATRTGNGDLIGGNPEADGDKVTPALLAELKRLVENLEQERKRRQRDPVMLHLERRRQKVDDRF
jgi:hypothetical protein